LNNILFGPFIGEFGWELCYWQGWVRKYSKSFSNSKIYISSFEKSYPLYKDFINKFIPISKKLVDKKYSLNGYFPNFKILSEKEKKNFKDLYDQEVVRLKEIVKKENDNEIIHLPFYPQRNRNKFSHLTFLIKKILKINNEKVINKENPYKGIVIENYLDFLINNYEKAWDVQVPPKNFQIINHLRPTNKVNDLYQKIRQKVNSKHFVTLFPRKRDIVRPARNYSENKWEIFIKRLVDDLKLGVFICGTPEGAGLKQFKYYNVYNTAFEQEKNLLDLQIALLCNSKYSIHSLSGSAYLPMYTGNYTFFFGLENYRKRFDGDNVLNSKYKFLTNYGTDPDPMYLFEEFKKIYLKDLG